MNRTLKICLVCIAWAAIGTQVALLFAATWWAVGLGLVCGSLGGYLTCDWRAVVWAIPHAWRRATSWRPDWTWWGKVTVAAVIISFWVASTALPCILLIEGSRVLGAKDTDPLGSAMWWGLIIVPTLLYCTMSFGWFVESKGLTLNSIRGLPVRYNFWVMMAVWIAIGYWEILRKVLPRIPKAIMATAKVVAFTVLATFALPVGAVYFAGRFAWHLYKLIHTEERWLVAVDIACGVLVGVWFGSPIVGGLSGGAFWVINRLLIAGLWLRTLPVSAR